VKIFFIAAAAEFLSYFVVVLNNRAFNQGLYGWTAGTDALFITQLFLVNKWMVEKPDARGWEAYFGFLIGGIMGSLSAVFVSKHLYGR
jgi:hypothetical protein